MGQYTETKALHSSLIGEMNGHLEHFEMEYYWGWGGYILI